MKHSSMKMKSNKVGMGKVGKSGGKTLLSTPSNVGAVVKKVK